MSRKLIPWIASLLAVCIMAGAVFSVRVSAAGAPSLFHNDEKWYKDATASLEMVEGIPYVPVDIFGMFPHIELSMYSRQGEFMLYNRSTGRYISVLYDERIATVDGEEEIYLNLYKLHGGYYYVPAEYFCSVMELRYELVASTAVGAGMTLRLSDGTETKTVAELLALYAPADPDSSDSPSVSDPPVPPVTSGTDKTERTVYLTFNTVRPENLPLILSALRAASVQATFFFTKEELEKYPRLVADVLPDGHSIALTCDAASDAADFLAQMDAANQVLCGIAKITTRIVQLPGGTAASGFTGEDVDTVLAAGYVLWDYTYDVPDSRGYAVYAVKNSTVNAVRRSEVNVLRMSTNDTVAAILPDLIAGWQKNDSMHIRPILVSGAEVRLAAKD